MQPFSICRLLVISSSIVGGVLTAPTRLQEEVADGLHHLPDLNRPAPTFKLFGQVISPHNGKPSGELAVQQGATRKRPLKEHLESSPPSSSAKRSNPTVGTVPPAALPRPIFDLSAHQQETGHFASFHTESSKGTSHTSLRPSFPSAPVTKPATSPPVSISSGRESLWKAWQRKMPLNLRPLRRLDKDVNKHASLVREQLLLQQGGELTPHQHRLLRQDAVRNDGKGVGDNWNLLPDEIKAKRIEVSRIGRQLQLAERQGVTIDPQWVAELRGRQELLREQLQGPSAHAHAWNLLDRIGARLTHNEKAASHLRHGTKGRVMVQEQAALYRATLQSEKDRVVAVVGPK